MRFNFPKDFIQLLIVNFLMENQFGSTEIAVFSLLSGAVG